MTAHLPLEGKRFGRWSVLSYAGDRKWLCRCDCGTAKTVDGHSITRGLSTGCLGCRPNQSHRRTHGERKTRLYNIWCGMKTRCLNQKDAAYPRYGGRGITICRAWIDSYEAFRDWAMANGYRPHLTIDRENNDGHYEPDNCRWATYAEQNRNYRRNRPIFYGGRHVLIGDLAAEKGLPADVVKNRVRRYGWPIAKALNTPVKPRVKNEPWKALGMSRSTWHRRGRPCA